MRILLTILLLTGSLVMKAQMDTAQMVSSDPVKQRYFGKGRVTAVVLTLLSGPIGGHRIYLGTHPKVPFIYAVTLGGGLGILPVIDLGMILFKKDLDKLLNNPNVFLWMK